MFLLLLDKKSSSYVIWSYITLAVLVNSLLIICFTNLQEL